MNVLYCGDSKIEDGLIISVLSLLKNVHESLNIFVLTMAIQHEDSIYEPVDSHIISFLNERIKKNNPENAICLIDATEIFKQELPTANMDTRFTPYCMLRLFADLIPKLPDRILYLDNDVICRKNCSGFYHQNIDSHELIGVLDYYGKWFFRKKVFHMDYLNSGVLLLNMKNIKETGLFKKSRKLCTEKKMFMPDQSAINQLSKMKKSEPRRFNEQRKLHDNTVLQHFTTSFRFFPWIHTLTVKPWQVDRVHGELKLFEYDDILEDYTDFMSMMKGY